MPARQSTKASRQRAALREQQEFDYCCELVQLLASSEYEDQSRIGAVNALTDFVSEERGAFMVVRANGLEALTGIVYNTESSGRTHMLQSIVDALSKPLPPLKLAAFKGWIAVGKHAAFRGRVAGCVRCFMCSCVCCFNPHVLLLYTISGRAWAREQHLHAAAALAQNSADHGACDHSDGL